MARFRIKPGSKRQAQKDLAKALQRKKKIIGVALELWMDETIGEMQEELLRVDAFDEGQLLAATTRGPVREEGRKLKVKGQNDAEHATVIEYGRLPRSGLPPPLLPLVAWAGRKGIIRSLPRNIGFDGLFAQQWAASGAILRAMKKRKGPASGEKKPLDPVVRDLLIVRLIAQKIFEKGVAGRHPFTRVWDRRSRTATRDLAALVRLLS